MKRTTSIQDFAALISMVSGFLFLLLLVALHLIEPQFTPAWHFISEFELGSFGWLMHLAFFMLAICLVSASLSILVYSKSALGYTGMTLVWLTALGLLIAGIFSTDPSGTNQTQVTFSGKLHIVGASLNFFPIASLLLTLRLSRQLAWRPIRIWLFISVALILLFNVGFVMALPHDGNFGPGSISGLYGRFLLTSYLFWVLLVGFRILNLSRS